MSATTAVAMAATAHSNSAPIRQQIGVDASSAAELLGWGTPIRSDEFSGPLGPQWGVYSGPGHDGQGRRTPSAVTVNNGILTITGDARGNTDGMAWLPGQRYGRWEARVRSPASAPAYHSVLLLWPDAENWPVGGEVDFMEISDPTRQDEDFFLHYGRNNDQVHGSLDVDATQWHDWAVEWTPKKITAFIDGTPWWSTTNTSIFPPGAMHMTIQLDYFPGDGSAARGAQEQVDWVRQYTWNSSGPAVAPTSTATPTSTPSTSTPSPGPSPSPAPSTSVTVTPSPSASPSATVTPSPSASPAVSSSAAPTPTPAAPPSGAATPAPSPSPGPPDDDGAAAARVRSAIDHLVAVLRHRLFDLFGV